jgi:hypothetical protein
MFEVDKRALALVDRAHEQAGLFARREKELNTLFREDRRLSRVRKCALRTMDVMPVNGDPSWDQLALSHSGFDRWHFVPFDKVM